MKVTIKLFGALLVVAALLSFSTCENHPGPYVIGTEADLWGVQIANAKLPVLPSMKDRVGKPLPLPINSENWDDIDWKPTPSTPFATMQFLRESDITNVRIKTKTIGTSSGARVEWAISDAVTRPPEPEFMDVRIPATIKAEDFIYLKVTSEGINADLKKNKVQYYRFYARVYKSGVNLASLNFNSGKKDEDGNIIEKVILAANGASSWNLLRQPDNIGNMALSEGQAHNLMLTAIGFEETSTFRFAKVPAGTKNDEVEPTNWVPQGTAISFGNGDILYVEVTAQNTVDKAYYRFNVSVGEIAAIEKLEFMDGTTPSEVTDLGAIGNTWAAARNGNFGAADQPVSGWNVRVTLEDDEASVSWAVTRPATPTGNPPEPSFPAGTPSGGTSQQGITFVNTVSGSDLIKDVLGLKIVSKNGQVTRYYRIQISLLPANILVHPRSAYYYYWMPAGGTETAPAGGSNIRPSPASESSNPRYSNLPGGPAVKALTVKLDRGTESDYNYQWYESNSWYGGYLFDADGRSAIDGEPLSANQPGTLETGFIEDEFHSPNADEKANVSLFNGGNQAARYVIPGRIVSPGGTGASYTPPIDKRPFLGGSTNEIHYYWVVVTHKSTGYTMTSERAVIISERDARKDHFIIDVNNSFEKVNGVTFDPEAPGVTIADVKAHKIPFKNPKAFKEKYDKYRIPLKDILPDDWDVMDYRILGAQAKFYLKDGTPWIQNWTNGNISFEDAVGGDDDQDGNPTVQIIVLYYNLTNNNATYLLASDSKEPEGAPLDKTPTHVVIEPSGDHKKGANKDGYPPLGSDGKAAASIINVDLQGWFCGFVELCELRFEGPSRK